jgi:hypothetical protein
MLENFADSVWVAHQPLVLLGGNAGARMSVVRLSTGELVLVSPIKATDALVEQVSALGPVTWLVGPNAFHHLFLPGWKRAFPQAQVYGSAALAKKRKDIAFAGILPQDTPAAWGGQLEPILVGGMPKVDEVVFWHPRSRTLIVTDYLFNVQDAGNAWGRWLFKVMQNSGGPRQSRLFRLVTKDKDAARATAGRLRELPVERVVLAHGAPLERDGAAHLRRATGWLFGEAAP